MYLFDSEKPFYKGNLHMHTKNSDGRCPVDDAIAQYQQKGYDFLAVTDHWKRTVDDGFCKNMLLLPGIEMDYTLSGEVIHIVGIGVSAEITEEQPKRHLGPQHGINAIRACGGRAILAHPAWSLNTPTTIAALHDLTATEVFNTVSNAPWNGDRGDSTNILDITASHGCLLNTVASDDAHFYNGDQCYAFIRLQADSLTRDDVLSALDRGSYYASCGPEIYQIEITDTELRVSCSPASQVLFHSNLFYSANRCMRGEGLTEVVYPLKRANDERFVRVIISDAEGRRAWSNPIDLTKC